MTSPTARVVELVDLIRRQSSPGQYSIDRDAAIALVELFASVVASEGSGVVNWSNAAEATKALGAGVLPPSCSLAADGALVIPDNQARQARGSFAVLAHFDKIVTASGRLVKSRDEASPALKAARAL